MLRRYCLGCKHCKKSNEDKYICGISNIAKSLNDGGCDKMISKLEFKSNGIFEPTITKC